MAFFSQNSPKKGSNDFAFDIDIQGNSTASRHKREAEQAILANQFENSSTQMINHGSHCSYSICHQLDILPQTCTFCLLSFCRTHSHVEKHECQQYIGNPSPQCNICEKYIRIDLQRVKNRQQYNTVIQDHIDSKCTKHLFEQTEEEKKEIITSLRCFAEGCSNHKSHGKKFSTIICKFCNVQCCLSHRLPEFHQCVALAREKNQNDAQIRQQRDQKQQILDKMYGSGVLGESHDNVASKNPTTERLRLIQQQAHQKVQTSCKNPHLLAKQAQKASNTQNTPTTTTTTTINNAMSLTDSDNEDASGIKKENSTREINYTKPVSMINYTKPVTMIPNRGTIIAHDPIHPINVKTSLMLAKQKSKNPNGAKIASADKIYALIYFPHTTLPSTISQYPEQLIPFSVQSNLHQFNAIPFSKIVNNTIFSPSTAPISTTITAALDLPPSSQASPDDSSSNLQLPKNTPSSATPSFFFSNTYLPYCTGTISSSSSSISSLTNNPKLSTPLSIILDRNWSINQCLDEITSYSSLPSPSQLRKSFSNNVIYTLSMSYLPIASFTPSLTLGEIISGFENDFDTETLLLSLPSPPASTSNTPAASNSASPTATPTNSFISGPTSTTTPTPHKPKSAFDRKNTVFLPLHLSLGWYIENK